MRFHKVYPANGTNGTHETNDLCAEQFMFIPRIFKSPATLIFGWGRKTTHHKDGRKTTHVRQERR